VEFVASLAEPRLLLREVEPFFLGLAGTAGLTAESSGRVPDDDDDFSLFALDAACCKLFRTCDDEDDRLVDDGGCTWSKLAFADCVSYSWISLLTFGSASETYRLQNLTCSRVKAELLSTRRTQRNPEYSFSGLKL